ncbi:hypothetical protein TTHERM_000655909 (macronuclear) [Tetrahymena thermophila SB210]|uniref:Uncharacterized protein n=1 Tax=Tetrahymena thermophila (strain SB210) TaxID=312017 RepID=W7X7G2_TETTS|nr:hypothetical protein TTHERM_000655909 [Tetrahymena thermophila SB210]EWS72318.1 hypothetical protein TTHERM_000655909 [Tetrahymena thermophila SB210]|eukprot:XP_012655152.1 hypothetical protein TTHERM_000655909 [Tetrahymena thermophila SB210]
MQILSVCVSEMTTQTNTQNHLNFSQLKSIQISVTNLQTNDQMVSSKYMMKLRNSKLDDLYETIALYSF